MFKEKFSALQDRVEFFGEEKKARQMKVLLFALLVIGLIWLLFSYSSKEEESEFYASGAGIRITSLVNKANTERGWRAKSENRLMALERDLQESVDKNIKLAEAVASLEGKIKQSGAIKQIGGIKPALEGKGSLPDKKKVVPLKKEGGQKNIKFTENFVSTRSKGLPAGGLSKSFKQRGIKSVAFNNLEDVQEGEVLDLRHYVPAGSYVKAKTISSVDAKIGVSAQANPHPVLFRLLGAARTAKHAGKVQEVDLDGCVVVGSASGDISSEKVYIKILKMTCSSDIGRVKEVVVNGFVSSVGKDGVRGTVISRNGDLITKSFLAGVVSGFGSGMSQRFSPSATTVDGMTHVGRKTSDIFQQGVGNGLGKAADRVADYLIKRAEQIQPIISIPAGVDVEIVFTEGADLRGNQQLTKHESK
jgi:conjugal transfer pilus assembly protein TraB